ncbi:MAG: hypothetical protein ACI9O6_001082 [Glaciecola sp.]|jgi:hypothetical protein
MNSIVSFKIDLDCFKEYSKYAFKRVSDKKSQKGAFLINFVIWFFAVIFFMLTIQSFTNEKFSIDWSSAAFGAILPLIFVVNFVFNMIKLQRQMQPKEDGIMLGDKTIEISEEGIRETQTLTQSFYSWTCVESVEENKGDLYLFLDNTLALIIPKTAFSSVKEKEEFRELIGKYT